MPPRGGHGGPRGGGPHGGPRRGFGGPVGHRPPPPPRRVPPRRHGGCCAATFAAITGVTSIAVGLVVSAFH